MKKLMSFTLIIAALIFVVLASGCTSNRVVKTNDTITVDYIGTYENGTVFDTSYAQVAKDSGIYSKYGTYEPLEVKVGQHGVIPGFEDALLGMSVGQTKNVTLPPEKAYGPRNQSLIIPMPIERLTSSNITPVAGNKILVTNAYGSFPVTIASVDEANQTVMIDFNDEMAGKTLLFSITVRSIA